MSKRASIRELLLIAILMGLACTEQAASAQDVSLELRTKDGRTEYHIGEPIHLQLILTSSSKQYLVDTSFRYPELQTRKDEFLVNPTEGWNDPLEDYRHALSRDQSLFDTGGPFGYGRLGDKPVTLDLLLNRYVRISKAGQYMLSVKDRRVSLVRKSWSEPAQVLELTSKPLTLAIVAASQEWKQQQLASALETLKKRPGVQNNACETLTSLGTPEAEVAMVDALEDEYETQGCGFSSAFLGVRNRKLVLEHMQQKLDDPSTNIATQFVESMAEMSTLEDGGCTDFFRCRSEARKHIDQRLFALLDEKKGPARTAALSTLVNETLSNSISDDSASQVLRLAAEVFDQLSTQAQSTLLSARWTDIAGPAMLPVLKRCAEADSTIPCGLMPGDLLLQRLNELSPSVAREVILTDIQKENPRFPASALAMLPDKELPEADPVLRERLESKNGNLATTAGLIQRYATGGIAGTVMSFLDAKGLAQFGGEVDSNLIAYLLRVEPDAGAQKLRAALATREGNAWYKYLLPAVAQRTPSQKIQPIAIDALSDPDHEVARSAAQALAIVGDEDAKAALYARLREWHTKWMGREQEMFWMPGDGPPTDDRNLGDELIRSIAIGSGWVLKGEDQQLLMQSAVTENQRQQVKQYMDTAMNRPVTIAVIDNAGYPRVQIIIAQYSYENAELAEHKLSQFPAGTTFLLQDIPPESARSQSAVAEIQSFLTQRGMRVEIHKAQ